MHNLASKLDLICKIPDRYPARYILVDPTPLLSVNFPCGLPSFSPCSCIAGCFRLVAQSAATCWRWFPGGGFFYPENGGDIFFRNVGLSKIYTAPYPRRLHSSRFNIAATDEIFQASLSGCTGIFLAYCNFRETSVLFGFLLPPYWLIRICNNVQN
jgi:hypothetical protein